MYSSHAQVPAPAVDSNMTSDIMGKALDKYNNEHPLNIVIRAPEAANVHARNQSGHVKSHSTGTAVLLQPNAT